MNILRAIYPKPTRDLIKPASVTFVVLAITILAVASFATAGAAGHVETVVEFDPGAGELPEGVTVDKTGNVFVSLSPLGQLARVEPGSNVAEPFGYIEGLQPGDFGLLGLEADALGNVYGGVLSTNPDAHGVWRFDRKTGAAERVPGSEQIAFPNDVAFDKRGTMYVTDTTQGEIWRVTMGGAAEVWKADPLLEGTGAAGFGFPLGANGIAIRHNTIYVGVTETSLIVTIPILPDGLAGEAEIRNDLFADGVAIDGIALDVHGNVYVANPIGNVVVRVNEDGSLDTLAAEADGLDRPTSIAFGTGNGERQSIYAVNFSVALGFPLGTGPALSKIAVGVPGLPQP